MKCANCGEEIDDGMKFCGSCGTPVPQSKKCPACGASLPLKMKFCPECGAPQDGTAAKKATAVSGISMGDKNVIAGDVIGKQEITNIAGNATIIKNEDATKQVRKCHVCGKMVQITHGFECPECGEFTCEHCYDSVSGLCTICAGKKSEGDKETYRAAVREALADGKIDFTDRTKLDALQRKLGISREDAENIETVEKYAGDESAVLSTTEKLELETIQEQFYGCTAGAGMLFGKIEKMYEAHQTNEQVLGLYLSLLSAAKGGKEKALGIIRELPVDVLAAYTVAMDICIAQGKLNDANAYLAQAQKIWADSPIVQFYEFYCTIAMYRQYGTQDLLAKAEELAAAIGSIQPDDPLEKSHQIRVFGMLAQAKNEEVPLMDAAFCKENGLYKRIVKIQAETLPVAATGNDALADAIDAAWDGDTLLLQPGTYTLTSPLDRPLNIAGAGDAGQTVLSFAGKLSLAADAVLKNVTLLGSSSADTVEVTEPVKPVLSGCVLERCGVDVGGTAELSMESCKIHDAVCGILVAGSASVVCKDSSIQNIEKTGIIVVQENPGAKPQSCFEGLQISDCGECGMLISGAHANPKFSSCDIACSSYCAVMIDKGAAPVMTGCKAHGAKAAFVINKECGGSYTDCEAYGCKDEGFAVSASRALLERCKSYDNSVYGYAIRGGTYRNCDASKNPVGFCITDSKPDMYECTAYDGDIGFGISDKSTGSYFSCKSYRNKRFGFSIQAASKPLVKECEGSDNAMLGFFIAENCDGVYHSCKAYRNAIKDFGIENGCKAKFIDCQHTTGTFFT